MDSYTNTTNMGGASSSNNHRDWPLLCRGGCGFFGTAENLDYCSKCYKDYLKKLTTKHQAKVADDHPPSINVPEEDLKSSFDLLTISKRRRICEKDECRKKAINLGLYCRCGGSFCVDHRLPETHACGFDYKKDRKNVIQEENPVCKPDKLQHRI